MGVSVQSAGGVGCAEKCWNEDPCIGINVSPHPATVNEEKSTGDLTGVDGQPDLSPASEADYLSSETTWLQA
jgi:hypothetical protein